MTYWHLREASAQFADAIHRRNAGSTWTTIISVCSFVAFCAFVAIARWLIG